jgi:predicted lipid-binding transport protein (Tim44 family)
MSPVFDIYTIIFLALAIFIFARLRSVLGQRTGRERPPYDPYAPRDAAQPAREKVVSLPGRGTDVPPRADIELAPEAASNSPQRWSGIAEPGSPLAAGLDAITKVDREFDPRHFLDGAKAAYEMIVTAFAEGDRRTLKNLLAKDVFDGFTAAIAERENRGETLESRFVAIEKVEITGAELKGRSEQVTVRFVSQLISVTRNRAGEPIEGSADSVTDVTDIWTFARDAGSRDPNWKLIATEAASA